MATTIQITQAQLQAVLDTCEKISLTVEKIRLLAEIVQLGNLVGVTLDQATINNLVTQYGTLKVQLQTQFTGFP